MLIKSLLTLALVCFGTGSARKNIDLVLNSTVVSESLDVIESSQTIDTSTRLILEQAALPSFEDWSILATEQDGVKETARKWRSDRRSELFRLNDGISAYNDHFTAFYNFLATYAPQINNVTHARSNFISMLEELKTEILLRKDEATDTVNKFRAFLHSITAHKAIIDRASAIVESKYSGENGTQNRLNREIDALNAELDKINEPVTVAPEEENNHAKAAAANFTRVMIEKLKLQKQLDELKSAVRETTELQRNVEYLEANVDRTINATSQLASAWIELEQDYLQAINLIESSTEEAQRALIRKRIVETLTTAKQQWELLSQRAAAIKRNQLTQRSIPQRPQTY